MAMGPPEDTYALGARDLPQGIELVSLADAAYLAQAVDVPASASGPLFRTMFPRLGVEFSKQEEHEITRWHAEGIEEAITRGQTSLRKVRHSDGAVVGLAGWVVERCLEEQALEDKTLEKATKAGKREKSESWLPEALDVPAWLSVSGALKKERQRAVGHLDHVCRITTVSIRPEYQGRGLGSLLMQHICEDMYRHGRYGYVLASPAGVGVYSKFEFETVGRVETPHGPIASMLRPRQVPAG